MADDMDTTASLEPGSTKRRLIRRKTLLRGVGVLVLLLALAGLVLLWRRAATKSPVPPAIRHSVSFPVYYPEQQKLPAGYTLDTSSFRVAPGNAVIFWVVNSSREDITFSEVAMPDQGTINKFLSASIPLHNDMQTNFGKAEVGAAGSGENLTTIVSLPVANGPWLIITAPQSASQTDLQKIIQTLKK